MPEHRDGSPVLGIGIAAGYAVVADAQCSSISMRRRQLTWLVLGAETPQQRAAVRAVSDAVSGGIDIGDCGGLAFRGFKGADLAVVVQIRRAVARALSVAGADDDVVVVDSCG